MSKIIQMGALATFVLVATSCSKTPDAPPPPPPPPLNAVLPNLPKVAPPEGIALVTESGADATQLTFVTPIAVDSILTFYRTTLGDTPYRLVSEAKSQGATVFMAEQDGPMIWVTVKPSGDGGTAVTVAGGADQIKKAPKDTKPSGA